MAVVINHRAFGPYKIKFPIDWKANPFQNKNWMHYFNGLEWLGKTKNSNELIKVLRSFFNYHYVKKIKNPYHSELRGDHTSAVRLTSLVNIKKRLEKEGKGDGKKVCDKLIRLEILNLQRPEMYRKGHNHGLMVDLVLLEYYKSKGESSELIDIGAVLHRSGKTVDELWHSNGFTKEHSVSYQEHNLPLTIRYFSILKSLGVESGSSVCLDNVIETSKKVLGFSLRDNGEYFPMGDSFRKPKDKILSNVYGDGSLVKASTILLPYSKSEGVYSSGGFCFYRGRVRGKKIHFSATCCWDSFSHKQNDDMAFCLEIDGVVFFDDPGYTNFIKKEKIQDMKKETYHSTIVIKNRPWSNDASKCGESKINFISGEDSGFKMEMQAERIPGVKFIRRVELDGDEFLVKDTIEGECCEGEEVLRRFILGAGVKAEEKEGGVVISGGEESPALRTCISSFNVRNETFGKGERVDYSPVDNRCLIKTETLFHTASFDGSSCNKEMSLRMEIL